MKVSNVAVGESPLFYCNKRMSVIGKDAIVAKINEIAERVADPEGIEIVEEQRLVAGRGRLLRVFIDPPQGASHADCECISQQLAIILDEEEVTPADSYTLSSR